MFLEQPNQTTHIFMIYVNILNDFSDFDLIFQFIIPIVKDLKDFNMAISTNRSTKFILINNMQL